MRIKHKKSKKTIILVTIAAVLLLAGGLSYYVFALNGSLFGWKFRSDSSELGKPVESTNFDPPSSEQKDAGTDVKQSTVDNADKENTPPSSINVAFTTTSQNGAVLRVRADIQPLVSGTCKLTLKKDSKTVTKTAPTYAMASIATCQGFDVPVSELSPGTWNVTLDVTTDSASGKATTSTQIQ